MAQKKEIKWFGVFSTMYCIHAIMYLGNTTGTYYFNSSMTTIGASMSENMILVGFLAGAYSIVGMIFRPIAGAMCEKVGRIKTNIIGLIFTIIATFGYMFAPNIYWLLFSRCVNGAAFSLTSSANYAAAADLSPENNMALGLGWFGNMSRLSSFFGPSIAAWGVQQYQITGSWNTLYWISIATSVFSLVLSLPLTYEKKQWFKDKMAQAAAAKKDPAVTVAGPELPKMKSIFGLSIASWLCVLVLLFEALGHQSVGAYLLLAAQERGLNGLASFFLLQTVGMFIASGILAPMIAKVGTYKIVTPVLAVAFVCYIIFANATSTLALCIAAPFYGLLHGTVAVACNTNIVNSCSADRRGFASSMYLLSIDIGYGIGSVVWAAVIQAVGYSKVYYAVCVCPVICFVLLTIFWGKWGKKIFTATKQWEAKQAASAAS